MLERMMDLSRPIAVYVEIGEKRTFAGAIEWPGWCRGGSEAQSALQALLLHGPRYEAVLRPGLPGFNAPKNISELKVIERLKGSTTTDFGAPGAAPKADARPLSEVELRWYEGLLERCWLYFDTATRAARGKVLRLGPRGGGRDLEKLVEHVLGADEAYLLRLGMKFKRNTSDKVEEQLKKIREATLVGLRSAAHGKIPQQGLRGGKHWSLRYFIRRVTWHVLDHAWEIEDRISHDFT